MTEKQAMVDKLKTNKLPWCFLEKAEQDFLGEHPEHTTILTSNGFAPKNTANYKTFHPTNVYRLSPDFTLPIDRWWYCNDSRTLRPADCCSKCVEVPPADLEYVRAQIERHEKGEIDLKKFELRKLVIGNEETWIIPCNGEICTDRIDKYHITSGLLFVRKAEAKKSGGWKEFEVSFNDKDEEIVVWDFPKTGHCRTVSQAWLYAIDRGMCPMFWFEGLDTWIYMPHFHKEDGVQRKLLRMRVWEEGK